MGANMIKNDTFCELHVGVKIDIKFKKKGFWGESHRGIL